MKDTEVTEQTQIEPNSPLVGQFLTEGREVAGISVSDFAKRLNLTSAQLIALENNELHGLGPAIFIKGYIKSYCKFLNLDEAYLLGLYEAQIGAPAATKMQSFSRRTEKEAHDNRLMFVSYAVLVLVIGLTVLWWWQNKAPTQSVESPATIEEAQTNIGQAEDSIELQDNSDALSATQLAEAEQETNESLRVIDPSAKVPDEIIHARDEAFSSSEPVTLATNPVEVVTAQSTLKSPKATAPVEQTSDLNQIVMHFRGDSWVEIFDASAARVAFGVKKAGYTMTVTGEAPFSVVLGKHHLVDIQLDGQAVDISDFPTNRLAKFNLPLTE